MFTLIVLGCIALVVGRIIAKLTRHLRFIKDKKRKAKYKGQWKKLSYNGKGILIYSNGDRYEGHFKDGNYDGFGILTTSNGNRYAGDFHYGTFDGEGTYKWESGQEYEGGWQNNKFNGYGLLKYPNRDYHWGLFGENVFVMGLSVRDNVMTFGRYGGCSVNRNGDYSIVTDLEIFIDEKDKSYFTFNTNEGKFIIKQKNKSAVEIKNLYNTLKFSETEKWNSFKPNYDLTTSSTNEVQFIYFGDFVLPGIKNVRYPLVHPFLGQNNICLKSFSKDGEVLMQNIAIRLLAQLPVGELTMTLVDARGLGANFKTLGSLNKKIIGDRILHEESSIANALKQLTINMSSLIQKYLGLKFKNIEEYNKAAGENTLPYHLILVSKFPSGFTETSLRDLEILMRQGPAIGIFTIIDYDDTVIIAPNASIEFISKYALIIRGDKEKIAYLDTLEPGYTGKIQFLNEFLFRRVWGYEFYIETPLPDASLVQLIDKINNAVINKKPKLTKFVSIPKEKLWRTTTTEGINVPIGKIGVQEIQNFDLSLDCFHALVGGATGSGKTVFLHTLIFSLIHEYSPEELSLFLLDFKEGTEFVIYRDVPHIRVLSIDSQRTFGLSILDGLVEEMDKRGAIFKEYSTANIADYRKKSGKKLPRIVCIIDEFQVMLQLNDKISSRTRVALDDIVRRGRSFGIHLILSTQTLSGVDLEASTISNIGLRIALKMNENDSYRILDKNNNEAQYLNTGEGIYNPRYGQKEANLRFQVAFLSNNEKEEKLRTLLNAAKDANFIDKPKLFDGTSGSKISENPNFTSNVAPSNNYCDVFVGEPNYYSSDHVGFRLKKQSGSNIIIVGNGDKADAVSLVLTQLYFIARSSVPGSEFYTANLLEIDDIFYSYFDHLKYENVTFETGNHKKVEEYIEKIYEKLLDRRENGQETTRVLLTLFNIKRAYALQSEGYNTSPTSKKLREILTDGPDYGIHTLIYSMNFNHFFEIFNESKILNEFETRIAIAGSDSDKVFMGLNVAPERIETKTGLISGNRNKYDLDPFKIYNIEEVRQLFG